MARESFVQGDSAKVRDGGRGLAVGDEPGQLQHPVLGRGGRETQRRILFQRNHAVHMRFDALATGGMVELLLHMAGDVGQRLIGQQSTHTVAVRGAGGGLPIVAGRVWARCGSFRGVLIGFDIGRRVRHVSHAVEVAHGLRLEEGAQVDRNIHANRAIAGARGHDVANRAQYRGDEVGGEAHSALMRCTKHLAGADVIFHERGRVPVDGAGQPVDLRAGRGTGLVFLVVFVEAVFGFVAVRAVVIRRHARHVVPLGDVGVQQ